ncbi:Uncharacterized protein PPKH_4166 [Pseudomonas putida]|nr:Uncharacterized protein PPKH_4166 [Pseudomonas putida]
MTRKRLQIFRGYFELFLFVAERALHLVATVLFIVDERF